MRLRIQLELNELVSGMVCTLSTESYLVEVASGKINKLQLNKYRANNNFPFSNSVSNLLGQTQSPPKV